MAKTIKKTTDKEAKKELRKSGALKGLSRKDKKMAVKKAGFKKRQDMRADMKAARKEDADIRKMFADRRREEAIKGGQRLAYGVASKGRYQGTPSEVMQGIRRTSGSFGSTEDKTPTSLSMAEAAANRKAKADAKPGETFMITMADGSKKKVLKEDRSDPTKKYNKAMYGSKVKAVKKAPGGASMKKMPEYEKGGALKSVPSDAKGLSKLPKSVRNKMGYMKDGGSMKKAMYGAKMKKKAMYGAKMKKKAMYGAKMKK